MIEKIDHKIINSADATIICSEKRIEQIAGSNPKKMYVIHNTPRENAGFGNYTLNADKIKIVYVGILATGRFIREVADFVKKNKDFEFHVGGFGKLETELDIMSKTYDNIFFYGRLPYSNTLKLEENCDILVAIYDPDVPNHYYAAPNKFYESLMLGKPVIMATNSGMDHIVSENNIGTVIDYSVKSLEKGLIDLANRRSEWSGMCKKMQEIYRNNYSWSEMEVRLIDLYTKLGETHNE